MAFFVELARAALAYMVYDSISGHILHYQKYFHQIS
jgi:hypothetical protein